MNRFRLFALGAAVGLVITGVLSYGTPKAHESEVVLGHRIAPNGAEILVVATK